MRPLLYALPIAVALSAACRSLDDGVKPSEVLDAESRRTIGIEDLPKAAINFDMLLGDIVKAAQLKNVKDWGIHAYKADFHLYVRQVLISKKMGEAASLYDGTFYPIKDDGIDQAMKNIAIGGPNDTQKFMGTDYIQFVARIIDYRERGVSRGQHGTAFTLLRDSADGTVRIIASMDAMDAMRIAEVLEATYANGQLTLAYVDPGVGTYRVTVKMNATLDVDIYKLNGNQYEHVAYYKGGYKEQPGDSR